MSNTQDVNYYLIITTLRDYKFDVKNNFEFLGFPSRNKNSVKNFKVGDKIIFYLTKISSFAAIVEVSGEYFYSTEKIWEDEFDLWPHRIKCKVKKYIDDPKKMIYIKNIWDNLDMISNKHKWGSQVQGSYRKITENDYNIISKEIMEVK